MADRAASQRAAASSGPGRSSMCRSNMSVMAWSEASRHGAAAISFALATASCSVFTLYGPSPRSYSVQATRRFSLLTLDHTPKHSAFHGPGVLVMVSVLSVVFVLSTLSCTHSRPAKPRNSCYDVTNSANYLSRGGKQCRFRPEQWSKVIERKDGERGRRSRDGDGAGSSVQIGHLIGAAMSKIAQMPANFGPGSDPHAIEQHRKAIEGQAAGRLAARRSRVGKGSIACDVDC